MPTPFVKGLLVGLQCLIWGSTWIVIRSGLEHLPPMTSAAARFWVAGAVMIAAVRFLGRSEGGGAPPVWLWLVTGALNFAASYGIVYWTQTHLPSGLVAVLWAVFPLMMALLTRRFLPSERLHGSQWLGFGVGFLGILVLFHQDVAAFGAGGVTAGVVLLLSPAVSALGTTLVKRYSGESSSLVLNRNGMLFGAGILTIVALAVEHDENARWTVPAVASVAYLAVFGTALTFGVYFWLMRTTDAHKLSLIAYVTPAIALLLGAVVGDEPFHLTTAAGATLVLMGVALVVRPRRRNAHG